MADSEKRFPTLLNFADPFEFRGVRSLWVGELGQNEDGRCRNVGRRSNDVRKGGFTARPRDTLGWRRGGAEKKEEKRRAGWMGVLTAE
jgi:hypothetical protein